MKKAWIGCSLVVFSLGSTGWSQSSGATETAVAALEQRWLDAQETNNPDLLAPLLADKVVITGADGKVDGKAGTLTTYKKTKWDSADYIDVKVAVLGDTAIATGTFKGKGTDSSGKPFNDNERFTDTWVKMPNGQWQCVASHVSPITK
jgi:uncharacterized protein (TIGR02246 family)